MCLPNRGPLCPPNGGHQMPSIDYDIPCPIVVSKNVVAACPLPLYGSWAAVWAIRAEMAADVSAVWALNAIIAADVESPLPIGQDTFTDRTIPTALVVSHDIEAVWQMPSQPVLTVSTPLPIGQDTFTDRTIPTALVVSVDTAAEWRILSQPVLTMSVPLPLDPTSTSLSAHWTMAPISTEREATWHISAGSPVITTTVPLALDATEPIMTDVLVPWSWSADALVVAPSIAVAAGGTAIDWTSIDLSMSSGESCVTFSLDLPGPEHWHLVTPGAALTIAVDGTTWDVVVDSRSRTGQDVTAREWSIEGRSAHANLGAGRAASITKVWPKAAASALAADIVAGSGLAVTWQAMDWIVPAGRLAAENETPLAVLQRLAGAVGADLVPIPGGWLVRPGYEWTSRAASMSLGTMDDLLSVTEAARVSLRYNAVTVADNQAEDAPAMSLEAEDYDLEKNAWTIRLTPEPWDESVALETSRISGAIITGRAVVTEQVEDWVEFVAGKASLAHVPSRVLTVDWQLNADLGVVSVTGKEAVSTIPGQSLAWITYEWKSITYTLAQTAGQFDPVQVYTLEP